MHEFLSIISPTVQQLHFKYVTLDSLKRWMHYNFPKMRSLEYTLVENDENYTFESDIFLQMMADLFPGLEAIKPYGAFDLINLTHFTHLRKLDLINCYPPSSKWHGFAKELQLLEELSVYEEILSDENVKMLVSLPKLRILTIGFMLYSCFKSEINKRSREIEKVTFNYFYENDLLLTNLKEFLTAFPLLEQLESSLSSEIELWDIVASCPTLKNLKILNKSLDDGFFFPSRRLMEKALSKRSTPLTINWNDTFKNDRRLEIYLKHPNLNISFESEKIKYIRLAAIQFHFYPLAKSID